MRIISGTARGTKLFAPKNQETRPTTDKVKESVFNMIQPITNKSCVLDLFAGTGSIGLEFISRGASEAYFVENNRNAYVLIKKNIEKCRFTNHAHILNMEYDQALKVFNRSNTQFHYIYIDPPYHDYEVDDILDKIFEYRLLYKGGKVIVEMDLDQTSQFSRVEANLVKNKNYGRVKIMIVQRDE
jgi:16S rRNA (guanine(966)-N(2))-methyltransferase RsmD